MQTLKHQNQRRSPLADGCSNDLGVGAGCWGDRWLQGKRQHKSRVLIDADNTNSAAQAFRQLFDQGQPQARAAVFPGIVIGYPVEFIKDAIALRPRNFDTGVAHTQFQAIADRTRRDSD